MQAKKIIFSLLLIVMLSQPALPQDVPQKIVVVRSFQGFTMTGELGVFSSFLSCKYALIRKAREFTRHEVVIRRTANRTGSIIITVGVPGTDQRAEVVFSCVATQ